jgi:AraC-like DNA-binding protein
MATVGSHYVNSTIYGAQQHNINTDDMLKSAKIPKLLLKNPTGRLHINQLNTLIRSICRELNDELMGFTEHPLKLGSFAMLTKLVSRQTNLYGLLKECVNFFHIVTDDLQLTLQTTTNDVVLRTTLDRPELDPQQYMLEFLQVALHRFASWYIGKPIALTEARLSYQPVDPAEFDKLFLCRTMTESRYNELVFPAHYLNSPLIRSEAERQQFVNNLPLDVLTIPDKENSLSAQISKHLRRVIRLEQKPLTAQKIASLFTISEQTLRRKLALEGISYQQIKDIVRSDRALELLASDELSITDIGQKLGFSEPRAFTRAFKSWTGVSPKTYRSGIN